MNAYHCPGPWRRREPDLPGRVTLRARDGTCELVFSGVTVCRLPEEEGGLTVEEVRPAGPAGRAILVLRGARTDGAIEARGWWVLEPRPGLFKDLHAPFAPSLATRATALALVALLGVPGMRGAFRAWHGLRTR